MIKEGKIMALPLQALLSPAQYLTVERQAVCKSEYFAGGMFAIAGASRPHNRIVAHVFRVLVKVWIGSAIGRKTQEVHICACGFSTTMSTFQPAP